MKPGELRTAIEHAARSGRAFVRHTPVNHIRVPVDKGHVDCYLKLENIQITGSFKFRGAVNRLLALNEKERERGVVAASTGNHGAAVACAAQRLGLRARIVVPVDAKKEKLDAIGRYGGTVEVHGNECVVSEQYAREQSHLTGETFISPYNDPLVIAGQGTVGLELFDQIGGLDAVFVALGGGGLVSGISAAVKSRYSAVEIIACSPLRSPVMFESLQLGEIVDWEVQDTLSDATAGGVEHGAITFDLCKHLIDRHVLVDEDEIRNEMRRFIKEQHQLAEGAAAVALAGFRRLMGAFAGKRVGVIICGGNVGLQTLRRVLA